MDSRTSTPTNMDEDDNFPGEPPPPPEDSALHLLSTNYSTYNKPTNPSSSPMDPRRSPRQRSRSLNIDPSPHNVPGHTTKRVRRIQQTDQLQPTLDNFLQKTPQQTPLNDEPLPTPPPTISITNNDSDLISSDIDMSSRSEPSTTNSTILSTNLLHTPSFISPRPPKQPSEEDSRRIIIPNPKISLNDLREILSNHKFSNFTTSQLNTSLSITFNSQEDLHTFQLLNQHNALRHPETLKLIDLSNSFCPNRSFQHSINPEQQVWLLISRQDELSLLNTILGPSNYLNLPPIDLHNLTADTLLNILPQQHQISKIKATPSGKLVLNFNNQQSASKFERQTPLTLNISDNPHRSITLRPDRNYNPMIDAVPFCNICCNLGHRHPECPRKSKICRVCGSQTHHSNPNGSCPKNLSHPDNNSNSRTFCIICGSTNHNAGNRDCHKLKSIIENNQSITDHRPPTIDHRPLITDHQPPMIDHRTSPNDHRIPTTDHRPPTINHRPPTIDHRSPVIDRQPQQTQNSIDTSTFLNQALMPQYLLSNEISTVLNQISTANHRLHNLLSPIQTTSQQHPWIPSQIPWYLPISNQSTWPMAASLPQSLSVPTTTSPAQSLSTNLSPGNHNPKSTTTELSTNHYQNPETHHHDRDNP